MIDEIIKLLEYLTENPFVRGAFVAYAVFAVIVLVIIVAIFVLAFRQIIKTKNRMR